MQVGCAVSYVNGIKKDIFTSEIIPPTRADSMGRTRPTAYATRTTRTALESTGQIDQLEKTVGGDGKERPAKRPSSATFNPVLDGGGAHVSNSARGPFQAWALDCDCAQRAGTGAGAGTSARTSCRASAAPGTVRGMMPEDCPSIHDRGAYRRGHPPGPPPEGVGCPLARPGFRLGKA